MSDPIAMEYARKRVSVHGSSISVHAREVLRKEIMAAWEVATRSAKQGVLDAIAGTDKERRAKDRDHGE